MKNILRRLRGALGHALAWGIGWFSASLLFLSIFTIVGAFPSWSLALYISANIGATGLLTGAAFSAFLRAAYVDRPLLGIRIRPLSLGAATIAAVCAPVVGLVARAAAGAPIAIWDLLAASPIAAILGGISGGTLLLIAQGSAAQLTFAAAADLESEQRQVVELLDGEAG